MKKLGIVAATMLVGTSVAFAASLSIPWFIDNAQSGSGIPHATLNNGVEAVTTLIYLKSNRSDVITCTIEYFDQAGNSLGPSAAEGNTFTIAPRSALAFRPVADDPGAAIGGTPGGQEGAQGNAVPDRPQPDGRSNGSATITWSGDATDVQGALAVLETQQMQSGDTLTMSYGHLLPPGV